MYSKILTLAQREVTGEDLRRCCLKLSPKDGSYIGEIIQIECLQLFVILQLLNVAVRLVLVIVKTMRSSGSVPGSSTHSAMKLRRNHVFHFLAELPAKSDQ